MAKNKYVVINNRTYFRFKKSRVSRSNAIQHLFIYRRATSGKGIPPEDAYEMEKALVKAIERMEHDADVEVNYFVQMKGIDNDYFTLKTYDEPKMTYKNREEYAKGRVLDVDKFTYAESIHFSLSVNPSKKVKKT